MHRFWKFLLAGAAGLSVVLATILVVRGLDARRMPDLELWHRIAPASEFRASDYVPGMPLEDYLAIEGRVFDELEREIVGRVGDSPELRLNRYSPSGLTNPARLPRNWNRTFVLEPDGEPLGGALLLHGLSDSPYSLHRVGEILVDEGYYVLGLRLPGHGTSPAALDDVAWEDWMAAARLGAEHVRGRIGRERPLIVVGYSTGGALAVKLALDAGDTPGPDRLILFSPAIGVTPFAVFASWNRVLSWIPYFEKMKWTGIVPEYDPFKYNSFSKNGGYQVHRLTREVRAEIERRKRVRGLADLPPILTFASLVDSTVLTEPIVDSLYARVESPGNELVLFDVNRVAEIRVFYRTDPHRLLETLERSAELPYRLTVLTNADDESREVVARSKAAGTGALDVEPTGLAWPAEVYSLSHVALPFAPDDWVYGARRGEPTGYGLRIGALEPRGEKHVLRVPADQFLRLRSNPFFEWVERRLRETARAATSASDAARPAVPAAAR